MVAIYICYIQGVRHVNFYCFYKQPIASRANSLRYAPSRGRKKVLIRARGVERVIAPATQSWDSFFLNGPAVSDDFMLERASQEQVERESFE